MKSRIGLTLALVAVMACGLCACASQGSGGQSASAASSSSSAAIESSPAASESSEAATEANAAAPESGSAAESDGKASEDPYAGTYIEKTANRGVMTVEKDDASDLYMVSVEWPSSAAEVSEWTFSGQVDADGTMEYFNCLKVTTKDGGDPTQEYASGVGSLHFGDEGITWDDDQDHVADETVFIRV
jgi:hypothetical protein